MEERSLRVPPPPRPVPNRTGGGAATPQDEISDRRGITAAVVEEADRLLAEGLDHATISARLGITQYVVGVMAGDTLRVGRPQPRQQFTRRVNNAGRGTDAATIRMIQRMLEVNILNFGEIAREAGVSRSVVEKVARGEREAVGTERPFVFEDLGERFLPRPVRCPGCGAMVSIVPCRACRARQPGIFA